MFFSHSNPVKARVRGSTLVAVFRRSNPPLVWKFDLERNHSFTLALQGEDDDLELGVTSPKGEFFQVARFATREDAEQAFMVMQKALLTRSGWIRRVLMWIGVAVILFLLLRLIVSNFFLPSPLNTSSSFSASPQVITDGVALPADKVLRPPP